MHVHMHRDDTSSECIRFAGSTPTAQTQGTPGLKPITVRETIAHLYILKSLFSTEIDDIQMFRAAQTGPVHKSLYADWNLPIRGGALLWNSA